MKNIGKKGQRRWCINKKELKQKSTKVSNKILRENVKFKSGDWCLKFIWLREKKFKNQWFVTEKIIEWN